MTGQLDLAFIHDPGEMRGVEFEPVLSEDLFLVCTRDRLPKNANEDAVEFKDVAPMDLMMPRRINTVRQVVDLTFRRAGSEPSVVAELEAIPTLALAVSADLGATILPGQSPP
jgi:LysR family nitrogen assimilation transcriptional regulator